MNSFLQLPQVRRLFAFQQVDEAMGLQAISVEKDFWVCWVLRELFTMPSIGKHLTFKGGTSLSKAWKLVQRFSEDIDIIVDKEVLGFDDEDTFDKALSNKQRSKMRLLCLKLAIEGKHSAKEIAAISGSSRASLFERIKEKPSFCTYQR